MPHPFPALRAPVATRVRTTQHWTPWLHSLPMLELSVLLLFGLVLACA